MASNDVFVPAVWNAGLEKELEKKLIFQKWTNSEYEGELKEPGNSVKISTAGKVKVNRLDYSKDEDREKFELNLGKPQGMTGASITLSVNQIAYYQVLDSDLAEKLRNKDLWNAYLESATKEVADEMDSYIASFMTSFPMFNKDVIKLDVNNINETLTELHTALKNNNVTGELKMEVPYAFLDVLHATYERTQADSLELMKQGKVTKARDTIVYHDMYFEGSTNVYQDSKGVFYSALRTKRALAFVNRCQFSEIIRLDTGFSDVLRGYTLFDAKVIFPKEGLCIKYTVDTKAKKLVYTQEQA